MKKKFTAFVLLITMMLSMLSSFPITVNAIGESTTAIEQSIPTDLISEEEIEANGHIARIYAAESDMNEICILNEDGSNSVYFFDYPVKYVDEHDGKIKDKSNKLHKSKRNNYLYVNEENNIKTTFPKKITKHPVITTVGDYEISIGIVTDSKAPNKGQLIGDSYVLYDEAFGENTAIGYKTTFDGYKEEIILYSEHAPKIFKFQITCEGLLLSNTNGTLTFADKKTGEIIFTSNPLYIYDSSEQEKGYVDTTYSVVQTSDYEYSMTIVLDDEFLQTEGLTYPIYIDPSVKYNTRSYIDDAPIYSARADEACGNHLVSYIGKYTDVYGIGRLLIRFPEMMQSGSLFRTLQTAEIISVKMYLYNSARGSETATLKAHQFSGTVGWNESTVTWNNASANAIGTLQSSVSISESRTGYYAFDITKAAKNWIISSNNASRGIIVLNADESNIEQARNIRTADFGDSYKPYIIVNYTSLIKDGIYYIQNAGTERYMDVEGPSTAEGAIIQQWDFHTGKQAKWRITKQSDGYYTIQSVYSDKYVGVENGYLYDGVPIKQYASNTGTNTRWGFSISSSGNYIITAKSTGTENRVLSVPLDANGNGTDLIQRTYSNDSNYRDEWILNSYDYYDVLQEVYGFPSSDADLIIALYDKVDSAFPNESELERAWKCARLLGGLIYNHDIKRPFWNDVAGIEVELLGGSYPEREKQYFVNTLDFTESQYTLLKSSIETQHKTSNCDFAHCQIALASRLAYTLDKDGLGSNLGMLYFDEDVSYLGGWLGDAVLPETNGTTSIANDDYCADLDAENTYRLILQGHSSVDAFSEYYCSLLNSTNRAKIFLGYINYNTVRNKVFYEFFGRDTMLNEDYCWTRLELSYPDTYNFLKSLEYQLETMGDFIS